MIENVAWKKWTRLLSVLWFDESKVLELRDKGSLWKGVWVFLLFILVGLSPSVALSHLSFLYRAIVIFGSIAIVYVLIKILSSKSHFEFDKYLFGISVIGSAGLLMCWVLYGLGYLVFLGFGLEVHNWIFNLKNFYIILLFGFSSDVLSGLRDWKAIVVGLAGITAVFALSYIVL